MFNIMYVGTARRTADWALARDVAALGAASGAVGVSFGAIAVAGGLATWQIVTMSVFVFAGGAQFLAVGLLTAGNPVAAVFGGLLLNARHVPFGLAISDVLGRRWPGRLLGSHLLVDESVAFALSQRDPGRRRRAYWWTGGTLFVCWQVGTILGILVGTAVTDPAALGLDAAFPASLLALLLPSLRERQTRAVALSGAGLAVLLTMALPAGLPVLASLAALPLLWLMRPGPRAGQP
jgi:4-azaleucine resistance transporter AzlC